MPNRVAISTLNARTIDIINTIRANASSDYQASVPVVTQEQDIPKVGEIICGYPAFANQFISTLVNRIASVLVKSATFNNMYADLKKGYLAYGEVIEEVFVELCKVREFSAEKGVSRELKRSLPDVRTAFHAMNWRVQYPITIQIQDLQTAFLSADGVNNLIEKIVNSVYVSAEYDEFLLFKYLMIKAITHGKMFAASAGDTITASAKAFRAMSNKLTFINTKYNAAGVHTDTRREDQQIFMDSDYNAEFDVDVLASAFNMDKATFNGKLRLIDDWTTFDNERFAQLFESTTYVEPVTDDELALMGKVKAVLVDSEWFQIYDNLATFDETKVSSGLYWNYFYTVWKTVSSSPFSNAIVFVEDEDEIVEPDEITVEVTDKNTSEIATVLTLTPDFEGAGFASTNYNFEQTGSAVTEGVAIHKYGAVIYPANANAVDIVFTINGIAYKATSVASTLDVGDTVTFTRTDFIENTLDDLDIAGVTLTPTFDEDTLTYTGAGSDGATTFEITPADMTAVVTAKLGDTALELTKGTASYTGNVTLAEGANTFTVTVTGFVSGATVTNTYTVTITAT